MKGYHFSFEGLDGAGKSTQAELLKAYLQSKGIPVFPTKWNSSELYHPVIDDIKKKKEFTPNTFSVLHFLDYVDRHDKLVEPNLHDGFVVISDRDKWTGIVRDQARGLDSEWLGALYSLFPPADCVFYIQLSPEDALKRKRDDMLSPNYYESGKDVESGNTKSEDFLQFQSMQKDILDALADTEEFYVLDGTQSIKDIQKDVRDIADSKLSLDQLEVVNK